MTKKNGRLPAIEQSEQAKAKNLAKWRASRLHEMTLPSGLEVTIRDVDIASIIIEGNIPNTLIDLVTSDDFQKLSEEEAGKKILSGNSSDFVALLKALAIASLVKPAIGDKADEEHILYSELTLEDKMQLFMFLNRDAQAVRSFRDESQKSGQPS